MSIPEPNHSPELEADTQAVLAHVVSGERLDPDVVHRIRQRAERITEELRQQHGVLDIGVPAIREIRDGA